MFRVAKSDGWNRYKIQKRYLFLFWFDYGTDTYTGIDKVLPEVQKLNRGK